MMQIAKLLTSAEAARRLGVSVSAVKRWADEGTLRSERTAGGHRRFHASEIERLRREGLRAHGSDDWSEWIRSLEGGGIHAATARLFEERARLGSWCLVADRVGELLESVGERWVRGELTVAEEHVATATLQRALALVAESIPVSPRAPRCLLACAEGDDHTLGLSLAEMCLREAGWRSEWIGRSTRPSDVCERVRTGSVRMVGLSASAHMTDGPRLRRQARTIADACRAAGIPLVLGGSGAWPESPAFAVRVKRCEEFDAFLRTTVVPQPAA